MKGYIMKTFQHHAVLVAAIRTIDKHDKKVGEQIAIIRKHIRTTDRKAATAILLPAVAEAYRVPTKVSTSNANAGQLTFDSTADNYEAARSMLMRILRALFGGKKGTSAKLVFTRRQLQAAKAYLALFANAADAKAALSAVNV